MTTYKLFGGDLGGESMLVRCNLTEASAPVEVDYCEGMGWQPTQYQCADCRHRDSGLIEVGKQLAAAAVELPEDGFVCDAVEVVSQNQDVEQVTECAACNAPPVGPIPSYCLEHDGDYLSWLVAHNID